MSSPSPTAFRPVSEPLNNWHHVGGGDFVRDIGLVRCQVSERGSAFHAACYGLRMTSPRVGTFASFDEAAAACEARLR